MIAVSLNIGGGICLIKLAKLYMCTQTHYKHDEDGRTARDVRGHCSVPLSHSGNIVTRMRLHTHTIVRTKEDYTHTLLSEQKKIPLFLFIAIRLMKHKIYHLVTSLVLLELK